MDTQLQRNKFKNAHVHSIAKKRKRRLEILDDIYQI